MQKFREPNISSLSVAKGGDQEENYTNHLATGMRKHTQGKKVKARKLDLLPQSISRSLPVSYFKGAMRSKDARYVCDLRKQIHTPNVDESSLLDGIHLQILKVT